MEHQGENQSSTLMCRYWSAKPAPLRLSVGGYPRMDTPRSPVGLHECSWSFCLRTGLSQAKFWVLSRLLALMGHSLLAAKLWNGWQVPCSLPC
jgi:hypothetical protein